LICVSILNEIAPAIGRRLTRDIIACVAAFGCRRCRHRTYGNARISLGVSRSAFLVSVALFIPENYPTEYRANPLIRISVGGAQALASAFYLVLSDFCSHSCWLPIFVARLRLCIVSEIMSYELGRNVILTVRPNALDQIHAGAQGSVITINLNANRSRLQRRALGWLRIALGPSFSFKCSPSRRWPPASASRPANWTRRITLNDFPTRTARAAGLDRVGLGQPNWPTPVFP
jgi:hypothetical protein